jgi:hypothetical protein
MKHISIGELAVSRIGLGAMSVSGYYNIAEGSDAESIRTIHRARAGRRHRADPRNQAGRACRGEHRRRPRRAERRADRTAEQPRDGGRRAPRRGAHGRHRPLTTTGRGNETMNPVYDFKDQVALVTGQGWRRRRTRRYQRERAARREGSD